MSLKCLVPLFTTTLSTKIDDYVTGMHNLASKTLSSIYNPQHHNGIMMETTKCAIDYIYNVLNKIPAIPAKSCDNHYTIIDTIDNNGEKILLLEPEEIVNGTTTIFGDMYAVSNSSGSYNTLSLNNIVEFLGLEHCSAASVIESLQRWLVSQIPTTTTTTPATTTIITSTTTELPATTDFSLAPGRTADEDNNWLTQKIDILGAKLPVWSILTTSVAGIGLVCTGNRILYRTVYTYAE